MAKITVYKIRHKVTGLYRLAGGGVVGRWNKHGKAWPKLAHLKGHLNLIRDWRTNKLPEACKDWEIVTIEIEESEARVTPVMDLDLPKDSMIPLGSLLCPIDGEKLHFEVLGMMRVKRKEGGDFVYNAVCPSCCKSFKVKAPKENC